MNNETNIIKLKSYRAKKLVAKMNELRDEKTKAIDVLPYIDELQSIDKDAFFKMYTHWFKTGELTARFYL